MCALLYANDRSVRGAAGFAQRHRRSTIEGTGGPTVILSRVRDPRLVPSAAAGPWPMSIHRRLALWAAACADHVLDLFERARPDESRPLQAIEHARDWVRGASG